MKIELRVIDTLEEFKALRKDWDELYQSCEEATIFLSWDWMFTWWEVFHNNLNTQLSVICLYQNSKLAGIAPFHIINSFPKSLIQGKTLCFIGNGESKQDMIVSQYMDFLVRPDFEELMVNKISNYLCENKNKWDFADFEFLLEDSVIARCFQDKEISVHTDLSHYGRRFFISELESFDDFTTRMGNRWRKMLMKKSRKLENDGEVTVVSSSEIDSVQRAFKQLSEMHKARWKDRTYINIFESTLFNEFHMKIINRLVPKNKIRIATLCLDNEPLASYYYFIDKQQLHYYQSGFYTENANRYSPLFLLVCTEIQAAIKNNIKFDFMFDENVSSYKEDQYAAQSQPMYRLKWSPYKSRMIVHNKAKVLQKKLLRFKGVISQS